MKYAKRIAVGFALMVLALGGRAAAGDDFSTSWAPAAKAEARLVAAGPTLAAFEVRLAPGAITYWRNPGDAGVPPTFDFTGSENVARVDPIFPAPKRIPEPDGSEAFGYDGSVLMPLKIEPIDTEKPVTLALIVHYAVCEKLCLPAEARFRLALGDGPSPFAAAVEAALAAAPRRVEASAVGALTPDGAKSWRLCAAAEGGSPRDLFVEPPDGWWVTAAPTHDQAGSDCFVLTLRGKPSDAHLPVPLRLTLTGGGGPVETTVIVR